MVITSRKGKKGGGKNKQTKGQVFYPHLTDGNIKDQGK